MPKNTKINVKATSTIQSGFAANSNYSGGRFYDKDGSPNVEVRGMPFFKKYSIFNAMLNVSTSRFILIILLFYLLVNLFFATIYTIIGIDHLGGIEEHTTLQQFFEAFFFSAQTLSTVGYGHVFPKSLLANTVAATESVMGILSLALATGLMYGRFSKPRAFIKYSENVVFAPYREQTAIMFRLAAYKHNHLTDAHVKVTLILKVEENGRLTNRFYDLKLEYNQVNSLTLSWTVVHPIDEDSPFFNLTKEDLVNAQAELLVFVRAFDEIFSSVVVSRTSYVADEFVYGAKFKLMYHPNERNDKTILEINKINVFEKAPLIQPSRAVE